MKNRFLNASRNKISNDWIMVNEQTVCIRAFCVLTVYIVLVSHGAFLWESSEKTIEEKCVIVTSAQNTIKAMIILQSRLVTGCFWSSSVVLDVVHNKWMEKAGIVGEQ